MKILDSYLARSLLQTTGFTLLVLVGIGTLIKFIEQLKSVGRGTYDIVDAALYTLYSLPNDIVIFFPMAALIGGLLGLGALASNSELVVMQAAGMSRFQIIRSVMKTAIILAIAMMAIAEWVVPEAQRTAKQLRTTEISGGNIFNAQKGIWAKDGDTFINIDNVDESGRLDDLTLYHFNEDLELSRIQRAKYAVPQTDGWQLTDIQEVTITATQTYTQQLDDYFYQSKLTPEKLGVVSVKPETLSFTGLYSYLTYLAENDQNTSTYELAFWRKVIQPITIAVMLLVALSFIFGPLRSVTMGARIVMGVVTGIVFYLTDKIFGPIVLVYELHPAIGATMPSIVFIGIATFLLKKRQ